MPVIKVKLRTAVRRTFRVEQVAGMFDVPLEEHGHALSGRATQGSTRPEKACAPTLEEHGHALSGRATQGSTRPEKACHPNECGACGLLIRQELVAEVPGVEEEWTIGAIMGPSGSGKTTLAKAAFGAIYKRKAWPRDRAIIDVLGEFKVQGSKFKVEAGREISIKDLTRVLVAVGLGSPPTWLKPYHVLSGGERFRAEMARALLSSKFEVQSSKLRASEQLTVDPAAAVLVIDEFTSSLDRTVAKTASAALGRLLRGQESGIRNQGSEGLDSLAPDSCLLAPVRFVAVTCHRDILPWLSPDWVVELGRGFRVRSAGFSEDKSGRVGERERGSNGTRSVPTTEGQLIRGRPRRPGFRFTVGRVPQAMWTRFSGEHYLSGGLAASASCYAAFWGGARPAGGLPYSGEAIGFCGVVAALGWKQSKRIQRLVVLPEFQGMGIGGKLLDLVAASEAKNGFRVTITASHPAVLSHCARSARWRLMDLKKTGSTRQVYEGREVASSAGRAVAAFEYVSSQWPVSQ